MAEPVPLKYRAFISYSHADTTWAKWLHRALEGFTIDKDLVGRETATGAIPKSLRPIFRDRDDFTAGHTLSDQTLAALDASHALIVICSTFAAKSNYVNEEIRLFKSRHPDRSVIPLIVGGKPGDQELECFPPALKFKLNTDGQITNEPVEMLAADAREEGDGKSLALAKVVAGLLGVSSDDIFRRALRERRHKNRVRNGIMAVLAILFVAASGSAVYAWQQLKTNEAFLSATLQRATDIVNTAVAQAETYGVPRKATLALLSQAEGLFDDMARLGRPTAELRYQRAWMLIQFARNYRTLGDTKKSKERAEEARQLFSGLVAEQPDYRDYRFSLSVVHTELGHVLPSQGNLTGALQSYKAGLAIADELVKADPDNLSYRRQVALASDGVGNALVQQGKLSEALKFFQASLDIRRRMAMSRPDDLQLQSSLAWSQILVGRLFMQQGDFWAPFSFFKEGLAIRKRLAEAEPKDSDRQRDLSVAYGYVGDALSKGPFVTTESLAEALQAYRDGAAILEGLVKIDPDNRSWQFDLVLFQNRIGAILSEQGDPVAARASLESASETLKVLTEADPENTDWASTLGNSYAKIGNLLLDQGNLPEALKYFRDNLAIFERLGKSAPNDIGVQRNIAIAYALIATVLKKEGKTKEALAAFQVGRAITAHLKALSPDNAGVTEELAHFDKEIADLLGIEWDASTSPETQALNQVPDEPVAASERPDTQEGVALTEDTERALKAGGQFRECSGCPLMVVIPPGKYTMGAGREDAASRLSERPPHEVAIPNRFAIGKYEVTLGEWDECFAQKACPEIAHPLGTGQLPAVNVSWDEIQQYLSWLSKRTGKMYRLPTEAEWEYAARAGTTIWGVTIPNYAWMRFNAKGTRAVGQKLPNAFGLFDVYGNVWEFVEDTWHDSFAGAPTDGTAWIKDGKGQFRVCRGGSWGEGLSSVSGSARMGALQPSRFGDIGFRVARTLSE
jgi:formylglycine-generating enzyme required for sulfatase activity